MPAEIHVVSHTHWDREWYRSFATFRAMLIELVEDVCARLEQGRLARFLLDGQTIAVADVLAVRPDLEDRLRRLAQAGKLQLGPWHVLADMTLVSGEALVRNLLAGRRWGERLGGFLPVGYCPDMFGHPPDLPRILRGFGLDSALVWRGAPAELARFRWRAPDGSEVLAIRSRYYNPEVLWDPSQAAGRLDAWLAEQRAVDPGGPWLLLSGGDHLTPPDAPDLDLPLREIGLAEHVAAVRDLRAPVVQGELRRAGSGGAFLLAGTLSTRMPLKQANAAAQALLERWVEPWLVWAGGDRALLADAWEALLANQAHDAICGCSIDAVHAENAVHYRHVLDTGEHLLRRAWAAAGLDTALPEHPPAEHVDVVVANPHAHPVTAGIEVEVAVAPDRYPVALADPDGAPVAFCAADLGADVGFDTGIRTLPRWPALRRHKLAFVARDLPPCGWAVYRLALGPATPPDARAVTAPGREVAADGWRLRAEDDGAVTLAVADRVLAGLGRLIDQGDAGDSYTHEPVRDDVEVSGHLVGARVVRAATHVALHLSVTLDVPRSLTADRTARAAERRLLPVEIEVRRWAGIERLEWRVELDNTVDDHRLRVRFPLDGTVQTWRTDAAISTTSRPVAIDDPPLPDAPGREAEAHAAPLQSYAQIGDLAVLASGLPEAEARAREQRTHLALTLLRCVGWLGRHDLRARTMGAGPPYPVPDAQCRGRHAFAWAVRLGDDPAAEAQVWRAPPRAAQLASPPPARRASHLRVDGALLSAWKPAGDGDGSVLRVRNPAPGPATATLTFTAPPTRVLTSELDERRGAPLDLDGDRLVLSLGPFAVTTLRLTEGSTPCDD